MKKRKYNSRFILALCLSLMFMSALARAEAGNAGNGSELSAEAGDAGNGPELSADAAVLMDRDSGNLIYNKDIIQPQSPGGITKIMTTLLLTENCDLNETVSFSEILYDVPEGSQRLGLQPGEEITIYDAACAIMLSSADDVVNGIAEYIAGSPSAFVARMNERAKELGCVNTHFSNAQGYVSADHYTCAYDIALIVRAAWENPAFRDICSLAEHTIPATNLTEASRQMLNSHQLFQEGSVSYQGWYGDEVESYLAVGGSGGKNLISIVMGTYPVGGAYEDTTRLMAYGFGQLAGYEEDITEVPFDELVDAEEIPVPGTSGETTPDGQEASGETVPGGQEASRETASDGREASGETMPAAEEVSGGNAKQNNGWEGVLDYLKELLNDLSDIFSRLGRTVAKYAGEGVQFVSEYAEDHFMTVFLIACVCLAILFVLIVILLLRCINDAKIRKKRKKAEELRREREAQIESMTVEELEEELRRRGGRDS